MSIVWWIDGRQAQARADAARASALGLTVTAQRPADGFFLYREASVLRLHHARAPAGDNGLGIDFTDRATRARHAGGKQSALARAFGLHRRPPMRVLDATCGLGRDSVMLASLGCAVAALERQAALYALLVDARQRAAAGDPPPAWLARWPEPIHADARCWLEVNAEAGAFDAIYIDPMFAASRRKAQPQKALAWLAELAGPDTDADALLAAARQHARRRVVVKQHGRSPPLAPPDHQVSARAVRFDIYLTGGDSYQPAKTAMMKA